MFKIVICHLNEYIYHIYCESESIQYGKRYAFNFCTGVRWHTVTVGYQWTFLIGRIHCQLANFNPIHSHMSSWYSGSMLGLNA